jgi:LPS export ABC transporter protein LptC
MQRLSKSIKSSHNYLTRIKYLKHIFIILVLILILSSLIAIGLSDYKEKNHHPDNKQNNSHDSKYTISNLIFTKPFDLVKEYKIFSPQYIEHSDNSIIEHPVLHLLDKKQLYTIIKAQKGLLFTEAQKLKLSNKIQLIYEDRFKLLTEESEVDLQTMAIASDKYTKVTWDDSYINSPKGFLVNLKDKNTKLFGEITGKYFDIHKKEIYFEGATLEIYNNLNNISLEKHVKVIIEDKKLITHKLLFDKIKNIISIVGDIKFTTASEEVTASEGYVDLAAKKLYLTNNVILKKQSTTVMGKKFVYDYVNNESTIVSDANKSNRVQIFINK